MEVNLRHKAIDLMVEDLHTKHHEIRTQAMQEGALAFAKIILGRIRSRILNPPGPNGGIQLDGQIILAEGLQEKKDWEEKLLTKFGDVLGPRMM